MFTIMENILNAENNQYRKLQLLQKIAGKEKKISTGRYSRQYRPIEKKAGKVKKISTGRYSRQYRPIEKIAGKAKKISVLASIIDY